MGNDTQFFAFLKFTSKENYADGFLNGDWYSNTANYFIQLEKETNKRGQGDKNEVSYNMPHIGIKIIDPTTNTVILETKTASGRIFRNEDGETPLICMVGIRPSDLIEDEQFKGQGVYKLPFSTKEYEEMNSTFGEWCLLITVDAMAKRIKELDAKFNVNFSQIKYVNPSDEEKALAYFQSKPERFFYKDEDLSYQREFRICIHTAMPHNHIFKVAPLKKNEAIKCRSKDLEGIRFIKDR